MKLLYIFQGYLERSEYLGVKKKICSQIKLFEQSGIDVQLYSLLKPRTTIDKIVMSLPFARVFPRSWDNIDLAGVDIIYLRYVWSDSGLIQFLKRSKLKKTTVLLEIPTFPYDEEAKKSLLKVPMLWKDRYFRKKLSNFVDRIVTFSGDDEILGIPTIRVVNGIDVERIMPRVPFERNSRDIHVIAVASLAPWHGYDRFIRGLGEYYQNGGSQNVVFHVVGGGKVLAEYEQLVAEYNLHEHVVFYGFKTGAELDEIYDICDIGLEILGCHRKGLKLSSTLKSREYWAKGLPFVSECDFPANTEEISTYIYRVPYDDSSLDIVKLVEFYDEIYKNSGKTKQMIIEQIRDFAMRTCDMSVAMRPVVEYIRQEQPNIE